MIALASRLAAPKRHLSIAAIAVLGAIVGGASVRVGPTGATVAPTLIAPAKAAQLVAATSGTQLTAARAIGAAAAALAGYVEQSVGAATHYHADYVAPYWAPMLAKISKIGAHIFYRWPGAWGSTAAFTGRYIGEPADPLSLRPPLRQAVLTDGTVVAVDDPAIAGPPVARAPNDVGGLLDTTKGWTLNIPVPSDTATATKAIAQQQQKPAPAAPSVAAVGAPVLASR